MARRNILVTCDGCSETWEASSDRILGLTCESGHGAIREATEAEAKAYAFEPDFEAEANEGDDCPGCGQGTVEEYESHPTGWAGRCTIFLACDRGCGYERPIGSTSVL